MFNLSNLGGRVLGALGSLALTAMIVVVAYAPATQTVTPVLA